MIRNYVLNVILGILGVVAFVAGRCSAPPVVVETAAEAYVTITLRVSEQGTALSSVPFTLYVGDVPKPRSTSGLGSITWMERGVSKITLDSEEYTIYSVKSSQVTVTFTGRTIIPTIPVGTSVVADILVVLNRSVTPTPQVSATPTFPMPPATPSIPTPDFRTPTSSPTRTPSPPGFQQFSKEEEERIIVAAYSVLWTVEEGFAEGRSDDPAYVAGAFWVGGPAMSPLFAVEADNGDKIYCRAFKDEIIAVREFSGPELHAFGFVSWNGGLESLRTP